MAIATAQRIALPTISSDPASQGRLAALRVLHGALTDMDAHDSFQASLDRVEQGSAPEAFKDAFFFTMGALTSAVDNLDDVDRR
jgi:hypothetical protein